MTDPGRFRKHDPIKAAMIGSIADRRIPWLLTSLEGFCDRLITVVFGRASDARGGQVSASQNMLDKKVIAVFIEIRLIPLYERDGIDGIAGA